MLTKAEKTVGFGSILMPQLFGSFYTSHCLYNSALLSRVKLSSYLPPKEVEIQTNKEYFLCITVLCVMFLSKVKWEKIIFSAAGR